MTNTLFEGLQAKAEAWCRDFDRYKEECKMFAEGLRIDFIGHLGAKSTDIEFHVLDEHLERVRDAGTTLSPGCKAAMMALSTLESRCSSSWKRSAWMNTYVSEFSAFADSGASAGIRWKWPTAPRAATGFFFEKATAAIAEKFETPFHKRRGPLGFVPVFSHEHLTLVPPSEVRVVTDAGIAASDATDTGGHSSPSSG